MSNNLQARFGSRRLRETRELLTAAQAARDAEAEKLRNEMDAYSRQAIVLSELLQQQSSVASAVEMSGAMADPGQDPRGAPDLEPLWLMLDLTPEGRGTDSYPKLEYDHK